MTFRTNRKAPNLTIGAFPYLCCNEARFRGPVRLIEAYFLMKPANLLLKRETRPPRSIR